MSSSALSVSSNSVKLCWCENNQIFNVYL